MAPEIVRARNDGRLCHRRVLQKHGLNLEGADPIPEEKAGAIFEFRNLCFEGFSDSFYRPYWIL